MKRFLLNFPLGVFVGIELALLFVLLVDGKVFKANPILFVTPFSSALILLTAAVAAAGILHTLSEQEKAKEFERRRKLESSRSFLPTALSTFSRVAQSGCSSIQSTYYSNDRLEGLESIESSLPQLRLSDETVKVFRDVLEFVEDEDVSRRIQLILREHQVSLARTQSMLQDQSVNQDDYLRQMVVGWAYLHGLIDTLYDFARRQNHTVNNEAFSITSSLSISGITRTEDFEEEIGLYSRTFDRRSQAI